MADVGCQLPFNNDCSNNNSLLTNLNALRLERAGNTDRHVRKTLPPTLTGLPGEAEIQYFVKVTVQRPAFYKENFRSVCAPIDRRATPRRHENHILYSHADTAYSSRLSHSFPSNRLGLLQTNENATPDEIINLVPALMCRARRPFSGSPLWQQIQYRRKLFLRA